LRVNDQEIALQGYQSTAGKPSDTIREGTGTVKFYDPMRGFGFIAPVGSDAEDRSKQIYVHAASVRRSGLTSLSAGQRVAFELQPARRLGQKDEAVSIRILLGEAA
jgi:cold shock protein